jgi:sec-independent protein translocase protein TatB
MFDIGFSELLVIGVVALLVIGPERLPKVARTAGILFGRFQRYVANVKSDIQREMDASELSKLKTEVQDAARSFEQSVNDQVKEAESSTRAIEQSMSDAAAAAGESGTGATEGATSATSDNASAPLPELQPPPDINSEYSRPSTQQKLIP